MNLQIVIQHCKILEVGVQYRIAHLLNTTYLFLSLVFLNRSLLRSGCSFHIVILFHDLLLLTIIFTATIKMVEFHVSFQVSG